MNCFEFQTQYFDRKNTNNSQKHLTDCVDCQKIDLHYKILAKIISENNFVGETLPQEFSKLSQPLSKIRSTSHKIRLAFEGLGTAFVVFFVIILIPKSKTIYEIIAQKRLESSQQQTEFESEIKSTQTLQASGQANNLDNDSSAEDFSSEGNESDTGSDIQTADTEEEQTVPTVNPQNISHSTSRNEIWRFNLKTDSPKELKNLIITKLVQIGVDQQTTGLAGVEAPGGVQINILINQDYIPKIKETLESLNAQNSERQGNAIAWYKNRSKNPLPKGKCRLIIWLSQI